MMLRPAINDLLGKITKKDQIGTRYELVIAVSKRAREINEDENVKMTAANPVSQAVEEIYYEKVDVSIPPENEEEVKPQHEQLVGMPEESETVSE